MTGRVSEEGETFYYTAGARCLQIPTVNTLLGKPEVLVSMLTGGNPLVMSATVLEAADPVPVLFVGRCLQDA